MKAIKITILGRQYPLKIEESEEETMHRIAAYVDDTFRQYKKELSKQNESTILTMAALSIAEELFEERKRNRELGQHEGVVMKDVNESLEKFIKQIRS